MVHRGKGATSTVALPCALAALIVSCIAHIVLAMASPARAEETRLALLIGNSRYAHATPLRNPENDVDLIETALETAKFRVFSGKNASFEAMTKLIDEFLAAAQRTPNPTLLVYFAGHGVQLADVNYLIPIDAKTSTAEELQNHSFNATDILKRLLAAKPNLAMLILDACRDNPFETASRSLRRGLSPLSAASGETERSSQLIAFATAPGTTADDGDAGNSPYAAALAESIIAPGLTVESVFRETRRKVADRTKGKQQPWETTSLFKDFYFIPPDTRPTPAHDEATFWDLASIVNSAEIYQRYLERYPKGTYAELAGRKIAAINSDFSYRRKAELFPIAKLTAEDFPSCTATPPWPLLGAMLDKLVNFENQLVYLSLEFPVRWLYCGHTGNDISYSLTHFIRNSADQCQLFAFLSDGIDTARTPCDRSDVNFAEFIDHKRIFKDGGLFIGANNTDSAALLLPGGRSDFYAFDFNAAEGHVDEMYARFSGLVRIRIFSQEGSSVIFDPVDPKGLGVSWKFDNTVAAARTHPSLDLSVARSIAAVTPPTAPTFSVLPNRAMEGHDIAQIKGVDEAACSAACGERAQCQTYLYDKWNRWCFLKSGAATVRLDPKYTMGVRGGVAMPLQSARPREIIFYRGKQFPYPGRLHSAADQHGCAQACLSDAACVAFTFERTRRTTQCKLMDAVGEYFSKASAISGVVRQSP